MINVVIFANIPVTPFKEDLGIEKCNENRFTSWNINLLNGFKKISDIRIHAITTTRILNKTCTVEKDNIQITYIALLSKIMSLTFFHYPVWKSKPIIDKFKPDIIHGIGSEHIWAYAATKYHVPYVITFHGILNELKKKNKFKFFSRQNYLSLIEKKLMTKVKDVIQINPYVGSIIKKYNSSANLYSIDNAVFPSFSLINSQPEANKQILFIGDFERNKNVKMLLHAMYIIKDSVKDWKLKIIGKIKDHDYFLESTRLIDLIDKQVIIDHKLYSQDEIANEMSKSSFLVVTSKLETAPMVIAEAMTTGIPVVATNIGGIKYMIKDKLNGYIVEPDNIKQLVDRISFLIKNPGLRKVMGRRAKQEAVERYDPIIIAQKTCEIYKKILERSN